MNAELIETVTPAGLVIPRIEPVEIVGTDVSNLPGRRLAKYASEISDGLIPYKGLMGQMDTRDVRDEMAAGNFALVVDPDSTTLLASARDAGSLSDPQDLQEPLPEQTRIVGTWLNFNGARSGRRVLRAATNLAAAKPGVNAVVAMVGEENTTGLVAMKRAGGKDVGIRASEKVPGATVIVFQLYRK